MSENKSDWLKRFEATTPAEFHRYDHLEYYFPWYFKSVGRHRLTTIKVSSLRARIPGLGTLKIEDTPNYKYVDGKPGEYIKRMLRTVGPPPTPLAWGPAKFDKLIRELGDEIPYILEDGRKSCIIVRGAWIQDGVHRAAIYKKRGIEEVPCIQMY